jgi:hypothetical protein
MRNEVVVVYYKDAEILLNSQATQTAEKYATTLVLFR